MLKKLTLILALAFLVSFVDSCKCYNFTKNFFLIIFVVNYGDDCNPEQDTCDNTNLNLMCDETTLKCVCKDRCWLDDTDPSNIKCVTGLGNHKFLKRFYNTF
jgi:hypothetical protein